jgi:hypothetical protein
VGLVLRSVLFLNKDAADIGLFRIIALAGHPRSTLASQVTVPSPVRVVLTDPSDAETDRAVLIHLHIVGRQRGRGIVLVSQFLFGLLIELVGSAFGFSRLLP